MQHPKIVIVAAADFVSDAVRRAWNKAGVEIVGPLLLDPPGETVLRDAFGVLLDVTLEADVLFAHSQALIERDIPFLFVVRQARPESGLDPFVVSEDPQDIHAIFEALGWERHEGVLH
ncbi:hypothetical protein [Rhizobium straminoryzae]|uniref:Uncharacterized protein n=1 Tax=Rhizobium straminoryzae TaxID=1387186 RepID=A0A549T9B3_9HYPH|nr:hypothetical protein [Rhizobium straminoryzae]TRL38462.1 hypothetical protein FNA46_12990 [Rhizobium straminoryzae]